jgi:hypothetical protein
MSILTALHNYYYAIKALDPHSVVEIDPYDLSTLKWLDGNPNNITTEQIESSLENIISEYDSLEWARNRENEYPNIHELVVGLYDTDDKAALESKRAAVKAKYPKP